MPGTKGAMGLLEIQMHRGKKMVAIHSFDTKGVNFLSVQ